MITVYNYAILNYQQNRQPAIHGANSSLQSMSALRGSNSVPLTLYARCYPMRYRAPLKSPSLTIAQRHRLMFVHYTVAVKKAQVYYNYASSANSKMPLTIITQCSTWT